MRAWKTPVALRGARPARAAVATPTGDRMR